jgi:hypothetical protein
MKNAHAVALGRLGGSKGGHARAKALSPMRRREIARAAGAARARALSATDRKELARRAAVARWAPKFRIATAAQAPVAVRRLLKSYDHAALRWSSADDRYTIVRGILLKGDDDARAWLRGILRPAQVRALVRAYGGAGCNEPDRKKLRVDLRLSRTDLPVRAYVGLRWRRGG